MSQTAVISEVLVEEKKRVRDFHCQCHNKYFTDSSSRRATRRTGFRNRSSAAPVRGPTLLVYLPAARVYLLSLSLSIRVSTAANGRTRSRLGGRASERASGGFKGTRGEERGGVGLGQLGERSREDRKGVKKGRHAPHSKRGEKICSRGSFEA